VTGLRAWRPARAADGPYQARPGDIAALNEVFSESFTDRYRKDGLVGVRVPALNPAIWRYALADAGEGAMLWRGERGDVVAFNIAHHSGAAGEGEGWMGPLAVRPGLQGKGVGKAVVRAGVDWLRGRGARTIGLETMPRTMDNIGFYSGLGFVPGPLTLTVTLEAESAERAPQLVGRLPGRDRDDAMGECRALASALVAGRDFTREIALTEELALGDTVLVRDAAGALAGFAICHSAPLVEGRVREELRVLKLAVAAPDAVPALAAAVCDFARRSGTRRAAFPRAGRLPVAVRRAAAAPRARAVDRPAHDARRAPGAARAGRGVALELGDLKG
jgi:GNAT superfamily N-acetyltransferase